MFLNVSKPITLDQIHPIQEQNADNHRASVSLPQQQKRAVCCSCELALAKQEIERFPCMHIFHSDCLLLRNGCPFGCKGPTMPSAASSDGQTVNQPSSR